MRLYENIELFADAIVGLASGTYSSKRITGYAGHLGLWPWLTQEMPGLAYTYKSIPTVGQIQASIRTILGIYKR